jgi:hypothetical protein
MDAWKILKDPRIIIVILVLAFLFMQTIRVERSNPEVKSDISAKPEIKSQLRMACYDCHSNETVWPWYSHLAPASWMIAHDVRNGRQQLNFSEWGAYSSKTQSRKLEKLAKEVMEEDMPPWYYSTVHRDQRLTPGSRGQIWAWALSESETVLK